MSRWSRVEDAANLAPSVRALVATTWSFRTRAERESTLRFRRLANQLTHVGADPIVVALARRAAHEEHRHSQLCAALCVRYGGALPKGPAHDHPATSPGLDHRDRLLYEVVSFACIAETINAQLLTIILERAHSPRILRVVRRLLKDEINHSRFGWAHLSSERQRGRGAFLSSLLPQMLAGAVDEGLFAAEPDPVETDAIAHGELPRAERTEIFISVLRDVIFPGLETFQLDTIQARQWLEQRVSTLPNSR